MAPGITGKKLLITGGAVRTGAAIAAAFAEAGAEVIVHARTLPESPLPFRVLTGDLAEPGVPERLIAEAGAPDILINNASVYRRTPFQQESEAEVRRQMEVNFFAPLALMKAFAAAYTGSNGIIINILDQAVAGYAPDAFGYLAGKQALAHATETAALAYAPSIRVNGIAPGPMLPPKGMEHSQMTETLKRVPLKRAVALEDITAAALFLAQNRSVTGTIVYIDGGQHLFETHHP